MLITRVNPGTGDEVTLDLPVTQAQVDAWESGVLAQVAFPNLTPDQREFLISGITDWNEWFGG